MKTLYKILLFAIMPLVLCVSCSDDEVEDVDVDSVKILDASDTIRLEKYDTYQINIETNPQNQAVSFYSSNNNVVSVTKEGLITAEGPGVASLYAVALNGSNRTQSSCVISVTSFVESIAFKGLPFVLIPKDETVNATSSFIAYPLNATNQKLKYKSSNSSIATVDENGIIKSVSKGIVEITASPADSKFDVVSEPLTVYSWYTPVPMERNTWTATASSTNGSSNTSRLFDGSVSTYWEASYSAQLPHWLLIDMKQVNEFDQVKFRQHSSWKEAKTIQIYTTDVETDGITQDDPSFTLLGETVFDNADLERTFSTFPNSKHKSRYIKLIFPDSRSGKYCSLSEINVYNVE